MSDRFFPVTSRYVISFSAIGSPFSALGCARAVCAGAGGDRAGSGIPRQPRVVRRWSPGGAYSPVTVGNYAQLSPLRGRERADGSQRGARLRRQIEHRLL